MSHETNMNNNATKNISPYLYPKKYNTSHS